MWRSSSAADATPHTTEWNTFGRYRVNEVKSEVKVKSEGVKSDFESFTPSDP